MKIMKRIATMLLTVALMVPAFSMAVQAADGVIFFTDLETKVGDTFTITGTVVNRNGNLGDVTVEMSYDTSYIQFMSGDGVNADSSGKLTYSGSGSGSRLEFTMEFQALQEGSTRMEQTGATVETSTGGTLECEAGYADITIGAGDPSKIVSAGNNAEVTIDGASYTLSENFTDTQLPQGFSQGEFTYNETTYKGAVQANANVTLAYLVDSANEGAFWVYDSEEGTFSPCADVVISDTYSLLIMDGTKRVTLSSKYVESAVSIDGKEIPAWLDADRDGFSIFYGVNSDGDASLYLYDSLEHTYQRMETPKSVSTEKKTSDSVWDKISDFISDYMLWVVVGAGCLLVILFVFLIVLAVKLGHRNRELDDLYDEYGIDVEQEEKPVAAKKKDRRQFRKNQDEEELEEEFFDDDEYDDEYYDDDDEYYDDDDDLADLRQDFAEVAAESGKTYDEYYDDDDFDDDFEELQRKAEKKPKKQDTFEMDFIDLD